MTFNEAIEQAERILPDEAAPEGEADPRWQAIIEVGMFIDAEPDAVWFFALRWGCHSDEDLRTAIATCLVEHLLEGHFDTIFPRVKDAVESSLLFADTFSRCWKFGQAKEIGNAERFDRLHEECRKRAR